MEINEIYQTNCMDLNHQGFGVCKVDGLAVFVSNMLVGEAGKIRIIKVEKNLAYGELLETKESSPSRVKPICPSFGICGGCQLMHMNYSSQLDFKKKMAKETFKRIGHFDNINIDKIIGMNEPYYYRNKVQVPFGVINNKTICGFYRKKSHEIIPLDKCYIEPLLATEIARFIRSVCNEVNIPGYNEFNNSGVIRHILVRNNSINEYMIVLVTRVKEVKRIDELVNKLINRYSCIKSIIQNVNQKIGNTILGEESILLYGKDSLIEDILGLKYNLSHKAFFQVNHIQTEKLYETVIDYVNPTNNDIIVDAYCGVGTISLLLAKNAKKVYGIEIVKEAINDAKNNAKINKIKNVTFIVGKSELEVKKIDEKVDVLVVDPPRKGCDISLIESLKEMKIKKIVYVSCDIATLARDLDLLRDYYDIIKVTLVDMFPHISEVETVCQLIRK